MAIKVSNRSRVHRGVPTGGQFAAEVRLESGVTLSSFELEPKPDDVEEDPGGWSAASERVEAEQIRDLLAEAREFDMIASGTHPDKNAFWDRFPDGISTEDQKAQRQRLAELDTRVCAMGRRVAGEAERRSGVSADELRKNNKMLVDRLTEEHKESRAEVDRTFLEYRAAVKEINSLGVIEPERTEMIIAMSATRQFNQARDYESEVRANLVNAKFGSDDQTTSEMDRLSSSYRQVLDEIRPMGGEVTVTYDGANKKLMNENLESAMACYPSDWIADSNTDADNVPLRLVPVGRDRSTRGRAYYEHRGRDKSVSRVRKTVRVHRPAGWRPDPDDPDEREWVPVGGPFESRSIRLGQSKPEMETLQRWAKPDWERAFRKPSRGKGWERVPGIEEGAWGAWRRARYSMEENSGGESANLMVGNPKTKGRDAYRTLVHEFAHRFEYTRDGLTLLEREHMRRRTTDENGEREKLVAYHKSRRHGTEGVRSDGFAERYMGKEYPATKDPFTGKTRHEAYELLSCAIPAVMDGQHGGLIGAGGEKRDEESRDFVLGVLASA